MSRDARTNFCRTAMIAGILAWPNVAAAQVSGSFRLSAQVPMACWISHDVTAEAASGAEGSVTEGCNSATGYAVFVDHRPLDTAESVRLRYGNRFANLTGSTVQEVNREHGPRVQKVTYGFSDVQLNAPLTLNMIIQPI